ncbi:MULTISPECIES: hypothetical protein [unclassified Vibrio]|uniref:hypothetical protein n=1 Tax=unclassified Vibrio TaxID=2614977 RepID=UPI0014823077|nr:MULTISPECIES: hypothetical protein [unclassified Vibrio]NNN44002.1 hypothetical protein [Vibrio sp. 1-1(7)]NNN71826.1 hypothetical protein [Vibrio sp. 12-2(3-a)]
MFSTSLKQWASEIFSGPTSIWRPFKGSKFDAGLFASPHLANCRDYFMYSSGNGEISPNLAQPAGEQQKAQY